MGAHSWFRVPALPHSCVPSILGTQAPRNANFIQERGNAECERIGKLNLSSCEEMTQLWCVMRGEVEGGIVDKTWIWPQTGFLPVDSYTTHARRGGLVALWRVDPACLISLYTHSAGVMSCSPPTPTHTLCRKAKQERRSTGECEKNLVQERGNAAKEKPRSAGTHADLKLLYQMNNRLKDGLNSLKSLFNLLSLSF